MMKPQMPLAREEHASGEGEGEGEGKGEGKGEGSCGARRDG